MKTNLTRSDVTPALKQAVSAYLLARTHAEVSRKRIDKMARAVLADSHYATDPEWLERGCHKEPRITEPADVFLMSEAERERYFAEWQKRLDALGYDLPRGHCPALIAEGLQIEAERCVIHAGASMMELDPEEFADKLLCAGLEKWRKCIDLLVGLVVNLPDFRNPLEMIRG